MTLERSQPTARRREEDVVDALGAQNNPDDYPNVFSSCGLICNEESVSAAT